MTFFEDVSAGAKNAAEKVGETANKVIDITKYRFNANELSGDIKKRFEAIGKIVYESRKEGSDVTAIINENIDAIDILFEKLDDINSKIAKLKNKAVCDSCGAMNEKESKFCSSCGEKL